MSGAAKAKQEAPRHLPQRARRFWRLRRRLRAAVLLGGRGGGRFPEPDPIPPAPARAGSAAPPLRARRFFAFDGTLRRASRMINQPIAMITSTPAMKRPNTPAVLTVGSLDVVVLFGVLGTVGVGAGAGAG
jgi:hypothetical protein